MNNLCIKFDVSDNIFLQCLTLWLVLGTFFIHYILKINPVYVEAHFLQ